MIYSIGVDIASIGRLRLAIERSGDPFLKKVFTDKEIEYCRSKKNPSPYFAMIFASKEAVLKGYGKGWDFTDWKNIEIIPRDNGKPKINLYGMMDEERMKKRIIKMHMSISYDGEYAVAIFASEV